MSINKFYIQVTTAEMTTAPKVNTHCTAMTYSECDALVVLPQKCRFMKCLSDRRSPFGVCAQVK